MSNNTINTILSVVFIFLNIYITHSQIIPRVLIEGKVSATLGDDVEGIVVYNRTTDEGTITNKNGDFRIRVAINDRIEVVAMQYQHFMVVVDKGVVDSRRLNIFLSESVNQLEEVVVTPYDLLGNVSVDLAKIEVNPGSIAKVAKETSSRINDTDYDFRPDEISSLENKVFLEDRMIHGLNFVNLFKFVYDNEIIEKKKAPAPDIDIQVRNMYNDQFFKDYLALDINQINDFIFFAADNGLTPSYFKSGKELDLIQFLVYQSKLYRQRR